MNLCKHSNNMNIIVAVHNYDTYFWVVPHHPPPHMTHKDTSDLLPPFMPAVNKNVNPKSAYFYSILPKTSKMPKRL